MLEANLKDLQLECHRMQEEKRRKESERRELEHNYKLYKDVLKCSSSDNNIGGGDEELGSDVESNLERSTLKGDGTNPFGEDDDVSEDEYDASGKNPFA